MNSKHRKTLKALLADPVNGNIKWARIGALRYRVKTARECIEKASGRLMLRVDPAVHAAALKASARSGQSLNKWAEKALNQAAHAI